MDGTFSLLDDTQRALLEDAVSGLSQQTKTLSPKWLYDARGSVLFEQITTLPEYYPTRTETAILKTHAAQLAGLVPEGGALVELGSGASVKTRTLLDAGSHFGAYVPIDISEEFLFETADDLQARYPGIPIHPLVGDFTGPLILPAAVSELPKVGFFPGSTIGNLTPELAVELLSHARSWPGMEGFILGADLVKDTGELVAAYDDAQGVTATFISNILVRLNGELGATFDLSGFDYQARWNDDLARIDMQLVSKKPQCVDLCGTEIEFGADETIHVSAARKYTMATLSALVEAAGWKLGNVLTDENSRFSVAVIVPAE